MTIILTIIAAVFVIIGLVVFNVRSASSQDKPEHEDNAAAEAGIPHVQEEEVAEQVEADQQDPFEMNDQTYRAILQKLQHPKEEKNHSEKTEMDDMDYRKALKSMKKREQD
ncbi:hypothetical protein CHCC14820_1560 [Bacillus paralicheniformis]|uniref:Uncharacterized protein n=1 Tax=Bacillus paralicheniformis TaxID=1648923 RepID=A0AAW6K9T2_9BACI|nr:hypothetical protein [Bacillus paralicheniformis]KUL15612.1 hypothetical protein LI6934_19575 [Bacillus licheniformis LMG 6934]MBG9882884.1 hypothetical protein [Bacillus paralicheniformis]MDE1385364.1 hypothetical protein [Bacillus paralicheniformis]MDE1393954.1 hypothetical protein [Bacillus paralicheniformis]MDE1452639.1 hypothetical protein [Bacillus paralicheniformis]